MGSTIRFPLECLNTQVPRIGGIGQLLGARCAGPNGNLPLIKDRCKNTPIVASRSTFTELQSVVVCVPILLLTPVISPFTTNSSNGQ